MVNQLFQYTGVGRGAGHVETWRPGRALGRGRAAGGTVVILLDLVLGKLRALAFDVQLRLSALSE